MTGAVPGPTRLLSRLRAAPVAVDDLRRACDEVLPRLAAPGLRLAVVTERGTGPVLVVEEAERGLRVPLADLAEDLSDAGAGTGHDGLVAALTAWVLSRPVPDAVASAAGVAVLQWTDRRRVAVGWRVVVPRGGVAVPWTPSPRADRRVVERARAGAVVRATALEGVLRLEGPVALWSAARHPALSTAALAAPARLLDRLRAAGVGRADPGDLHVVVTPDSPLACAGAAVAARLAGETGEACVRLPWTGLPRLRWL
ncbi:hypothetical protein [Geodermatophilus marinus]|uniref:hypothetical protein n=1 Tax=Geodermatophilus sp. LHW52908 TaxID=2303986 RepID=UPI000E3E3F5C|nr:hypothetical protein [Geodermatophilus sp. LHW52908]RFU22890.1 hypothetical protein D0Z06_03240 [Geodermatophilus sp. LHW52908]